MPRNRLAQPRALARIAAGLPVYGCGIAKVLEALRAKGLIFKSKGKWHAANASNEHPT